MSVNLVIGASHKTYFGYRQTQVWCREVADQVRRLPHELTTRLEMFTFPAMPAVSLALDYFTGTAMATGAQNVCAAPPGAWTGEASAAMLREMGCRYVEIGHAERRRYFGESVTLIKQKIDMAFNNDLIPVICIGEDRRMSAENASAFAINQVQELFGHYAQGTLPAAIFAWEPQWAIGASEPAGDEYIRQVCGALRTHLQQHYRGQMRVIYGGSAGPGLLGRLWPAVDGLFLGRFAHRPQAMAALFEEARHLLAAHDIAGQ